MIGLYEFSWLDPFYVINDASKFGFDMLHSNNIKDRVHIISSILAKLPHLIKQRVFLLLQLLQTLLNLPILLYRIVQFRSLLDALDRLHVINLLLLHCYFFILALELHESGQDGVLLHLFSK